MTMMTLFHRLDPSMTMMLTHLFGWDLNSDDQQKVSLNLQNLSLA